MKCIRISNDGDFLLYIRPKGESPSTRESIRALRVRDGNGNPLLLPLKAKIAGYSPTLGAR